MSTAVGGFRHPRVLTIAGSDSGGGAGIQADLKTIAALGCYGSTAITALTAQNTLGVRAIHAVPGAFVRAQIDAVLEDIGTDAVKIGMLHDAEVIDAVADALDVHRPRHVVLDPVMISTSGSRLIDDAAVERLVTQLFPRASLVTPNLDEAETLLGRSLRDPDLLVEAAQALIALGAKAVLLKGGHLPGTDTIDVLVAPGIEPQVLRAPRIDTPNTHGTGCTLSSAIAARLALGDDLRVAVERARAYVRAALEAGADVRCGAGSGPLEHGFDAQRQVRVPISSN